MIAKREVRTYPNSVKVWVGKYRNSHNLLHWHYDCELLYVENGAIDVFCDRQTHALSVGDALFADRGQVHYMTAKDPDTTLIVIIFGYEIVRPYLDAVRLASPRLKGSYPIPEVYREVREILLKGEPFSGGEAAGKIVSLMCSVFRGEALVPREATDETTRRFTELLSELSEKCASFTFSDAASFMGMSDAYFSRYFHACTGMPFTQYLNCVRVENAVALLTERAGLTMTEIAEKCGFGTIRNFNRCFKRLTGYAPSALPEGFVLREALVSPSADSFDPTLRDCELIESSHSK